MDVLLGFCIGSFLGEIIMGVSVTIFLHHRWYGKWIPQRKNYPFSTKLKENYNIDVELK